MCAFIEPSSNLIVEATSREIYQHVQSVADGMIEVGLVDAQDRPILVGYLKCLAADVQIEVVRMDLARKGQEEGRK